MPQQTNLDLRGEGPLRRCGAFKLGLEARGGTPQADKRRDGIWEPSEFQVGF